jgi:hypothetical protein
LVAQVLRIRGCNALDCDDFKLLREPRRILANMRSGTFESYVRTYASAWPSGAESVTAVPPAPATAATISTTTSALPQTASGGGISPKLDFPSASSIPPVSIMNAETSGPLSPAEPRATAAPPRRSSSTPSPSSPSPARRQSAREPAPPPMALVPQAATPEQPQTSETR